MRMYENLLDTNLYADDPQVATFIENLNEPEIESTSDAQLLYLQENMMATDDINECTYQLTIAALEKVRQQGTLLPEFIGYTEPTNSITLTSDIPQTKRQVENFLIAGKALAFARCCPGLFFCAMQPIIDKKPIFGRGMKSNTPWGIMIIGSSLRGNCFVFLSELIINNQSEFDIRPIERGISREGKYHYPYNRFFHISDEDEMRSLIKQLPKIVARTEGMTEKDCLINFSTTLKALQHFGYTN